MGRRGCTGPADSEQLLLAQAAREGGGGGSAEPSHGAALAAVVERQHALNTRKASTSATYLFTWNTFHVQWRFLLGKCV